MIIEPFYARLDAERHKQAERQRKMKQRLTKLWFLLPLLLIWIYSYVAYQIDWRSHEWMTFPALATASISFILSALYAISKQFE